MTQLSLNIDQRWSDAAAKAKRNRTVFAQRRLRPEDVLPEWQKSLAALGGQEDVRRFTSRALARLGGALEPLSTTKPDRGFKSPLGALPVEVRERLELEGLEGTVRVDFTYPPASRCHAVQRSHPLVSVLAETLLERTLVRGATPDASDPGVLGRVGCWIAPGVQARTLLALVRLRHQLSTHRGRDAATATTLLVEEATAIAWAPGAETLEGPAALALLTPDAVGDPPAHVRERLVGQALTELESRLGDLDAFAERRALALLDDHRRVRDASDARGTPRARALLPADVIGLFVLLPEVR
jgi:hypothetical protein